MSRELKKRGFRFMGRTVRYAFMQAVGMVNDHEANFLGAKGLARGKARSDVRASH
jgi:3-methyladenine DNA glycosylase Tag